MVNKCIINNCKTTAVKGSKVHVIPKGNIGQLWIQAIQQFQPNFRPTSRSIVCRLHFLSTDYSHSVIGGKLMLKKFAVPSIFNALLVQCNDLVEEIEVTINDLPSTSSSQTCLFPSVKSIESNEEIEISIDDLSSSSNLQTCLFSSIKAEKSDEEVEVSLSEKQPRKRKSYIYDFEEDDLNSPSKRKIYWYKSQEVYKQQQLKIQQLRSINQGLKKRLKTMENLIDHLKNEKKMSENNLTMLKGK